jgi:transcriptional regulator of acetoin/glycerol metabolism
LPSALSHAIGSETRRPIAMVVVCGTICAALLTLVVPDHSDFLPRARRAASPAGAQVAVPRARRAFLGGTSAAKPLNMAVSTDSTHIETLASLDEVLRNHVIAVLAACNGNRTLAARALKIDRKTIYRMLQRWQRDVA